MCEPFFGEVCIMPYSYAPQGWAWCNGQTMYIQQNNVLYAIIGTQFGGDGKTTYKLPDLRARAPMHYGQGPGLSPYPFAAATGAAAVQLNQSQLPSHTHTAQGSIQSTGYQATPTNSSYPGIMLKPATASTKQIAVWGYNEPDANDVLMSPLALATAGTSLAPSHENRQPCLGINFCIALDGIFPSRN